MEAGRSSNIHVELFLATNGDIGVADNLVDLQAIRIMKDQPTDGHIFNMEGAGSNGQPTPRCVWLMVC